MRDAILFADSGGSKTDWVLVVDDKIRESFTTVSYHPQEINRGWTDRQKLFWTDYLEKYNIELFFYGSGCLSEINCQLLDATFSEIGFTKIHIHSDILGAARACFGREDGVVAILGTGSVVAKIEKDEIVEIHGGLGYLLGDEGGGYYFGKLFLQRYFHRQLCEQSIEFLEKSFGNRSKIIAQVYGSDGKSFIANLSKTCGSLELPSIREIHRENIQKFLNLYLSEIKVCNTISFVGSYAFYNTEILENELTHRGWQIGEICSRPIEGLVKYFVKNGF